MESEVEMSPLTFPSTSQITEKTVSPISKGRLLRARLPAGSFTSTSERMLARRTRRGHAG